MHTGSAGREARVSPYRVATYVERRDTLTETLHLTVPEIERLPADEHDAIAHESQLWLEAHEWDALVHSPKSQHLLEHLATEARA